MARFEITGPDGRRYEITTPEGTSEKDALSYMQSQIGQQRAQAAPKPDPMASIDWNAPENDIRTTIRTLPEDMRKKATAEWSRRRVADQRKSAGGMQTVYDVGRNLARGTPIGSWIDEGVAGVAALRGGDYDEALAMERAKNDAADASGTKIGSLPVIGDVTTSGLTKLAGGILSAPLTPGLTLARGAAMAPRMINAAATGAGYGALYGAGEGEGSERVVNAGIGGVLGGGIGAAAPAVAQGVGNAVTGLRNMSQRPVALRPYDRGAVERVARAASDDGVVAGRTPSYPQQAQELGPLGMLADMGENLRGQAGAIANSPGRGQSRIVEALEGRREGAAGRITQDIDQALGAPVNVPRTVENMKRASNNAARPLYDQFRATPIQPTGRLGDLLERAQASGAYERARRMMQVEGVDPGQAQNNGMFIDYIKRAVDDLASAAPPRSNEQRVFSNLAREIRTEVDTMLSPNDPTQSIWAQARRMAGDGLQFEEAAEMGQGAFRRSLTPEQMDMDMSRMNPWQTSAYRVGARDAARTVMGNAGTAWGPNGDTAARRVLQTQFGADKMRRIAQTPEAADQLSRRLQTETRFAETETEALRNSATARRQAAQQEFPAPTGSGEAAYRMGTRTVPGIVMEGAYRVGNLLTAGALNERRIRIADQAAQMLVAQGAQRDHIAQGLRQYVARQRMSGEQAARISRFIERLERGVAPAQVGSQSQPLEVTVYPQGDPRNRQ